MAGKCDRQNVICVASSGIAALLLPGGTTSHSRFKIPLQVTDDTTCNMTRSMPVKRPASLKAGKHYNLDRYGNDEAALAYSRGSEPIRECTTCSKGSGIFEKCIVLNGVFKRFCCSCHYNSKRRRCSLRSLRT